MEFRKATQDWDELLKKFAHTFEFTDKKLAIDAALQTIKMKIFVEILVEVVHSDQCSAIIQHWMACYNLA